MNGRSLSGSSHAEAIAAFKAIRHGTVTLTVGRRARRRRDVQGNPSTPVPPKQSGDASETPRTFYKQSGDVTETSRTSHGVEGFKGPSQSVAPVTETNLDNGDPMVGRSSAKANIEAKFPDKSNGQISSGCHGNRYVSNGEDVVDIGKKFDTGNGPAYDTRPSPAMSKSIPASSDVPKGRPKSTVGVLMRQIEQKTATLKV